MDSKHILDRISVVRGATLQRATRTRIDIGREERRDRHHPEGSVQRAASGKNPRESSIGISGALRTAISDFLIAGPSRLATPCFQPASKRRIRLGFDRIFLKDTSTRVTLKDPPWPSTPIDDLRMVDEFDYSAILDRPNVTAAAIDRIVAALSSNMSQPVASSSTALIPNYTFDDLEVSLNL